MNSKISNFVLEDGKLKTPNNQLTFGVAYLQIVKTRLWVYVIYFPVHCAAVTNMSPHDNLSPTVKLYLSDRFSSSSQLILVESTLCWDLHRAMLVILFIILLFCAIYLYFLFWCD